MVLMVLSERCERIEQSVLREDLALIVFYALGPGIHRTPEIIAMWRKLFPSCFEKWDQADDPTATPRETVKLTPRNFRTGRRRMAIAIRE
jgi:hypothetical protein